MTLDVLNDTNARRSANAAAAAIARIAAVISQPSDRTQPSELAAAQLRLDHPTLTLRELGDLCGMTKDAYASLLNRFLAKNGKSPR